MYQTIKERKAYKLFNIITSYKFELKHRRLTNQE